VDSTSVFAGLGLSGFTIFLVVLLALAFSAYVKIVTVLSILRLGLGLCSLASSFVVGSLALALSFFVMYPTLAASSGAIDDVLKAAGTPVTDKVRAEAFDAGLEKWKTFLRAQAHKETVERFADLAGRFDAANAGAAPAQQPRGDVQAEPLTSSWRVLGPAFIVSELKEAFAAGLTLFLPFLVLDLFMATALTAVGLERMNPAMVAFPFKLLLFVVLDGWTLITGNLVSTYF